MAMNMITGFNSATIIQPAFRDESKLLRRANETRINSQENNRQQMNPESAPDKAQTEAQLASKRAQVLIEEAVQENNLLPDDIAAQIAQLLQLNLSGGKTRGVLVDLLA